MSEKTELSLELRANPGISKDEALQRVAKVKLWYHRVEVLPGVFTPGTNDSYAVLAKLQLPADLTGLRVLDIGARDGFFSLVCEQRGAREVVAIDHEPVENTGFPVLREIFNSRVKYFTENVYNLSVQNYGKFDVVLCLGLLYHLRNPLLALSAIRDACIGTLYVESYVIDPWLSSTNQDLLDAPIMRFYPRDELGGVYTNWWGPNSLCLKEMIESTNFTVLSQRTEGDRSTLRCTVDENHTKSYYRAIEGGLVP